MENTDETFDHISKFSRIERDYKELSILSCNTRKF